MSKQQKANQKVDGAVDDTFSALAVVNGQASKLINSPEERKKAWASAKEAPLAYSFGLFQFLGSIIPVSLSAGFVFISGLLALAVTGVVFSFAFCAGLAVLIPVLMFTVPTAAFVWLLVVGTLAAADWLYRNIYIDAGVQAKITEIKDEVVQEYTEIEENAAKEYSGYRQQAIETGQEAKERGGQMYDDASRKAGQAYDQASQKAGQLKQRAIEAGDETLDTINNKASQLQQNGYNLKEEAKSNADAVGQKGKEFIDQSKQSSKNMANATDKELRR